MTVTIESLTHLGMGKTAMGDLFARVLPGEVIDPQPDGTARIITPSTDRVSPPCRHFKSCGGCAMQHATDSFVADWKQSIVQRALSARGLAPEFLPLQTSPPQSRRRAKFAGKRTKKGAMVGFHMRGSDAMVAVSDCQLLTPSLLAIMPALEELTVMAASRKGEIALTVTDSHAGADIHVETTQALTGALRVTLAQYAQTRGIARLAWGDETIVEISAPQQRFGTASVTPPPGAFLQATAAGEASLLAAVTRILGTSKSVVDLFAGCGTFTLPLAAQAEVHAYEGAPNMIAALDRGWRAAQGLKRVVAQTRDLFRRPLEPDELARFDAAVIDPPRAGAEAQISTLAKSTVPVVAMVSCNPVTFARDAEILTQSGYRCDWVQVIDQFRWSTHVEMVGSFTRA